jgi:hypothetical protein
MLMSESVFEWMIITALILSCLAPVVLLVLWVKDLISKTIW